MPRNSITRQRKLSVDAKGWAGCAGKFSKLIFTHFYFLQSFDGTREKFWFSSSVRFVRFETQPSKHQDWKSLEVPLIKWYFQYSLFSLTWVKIKKNVSQLGKKLMILVTLLTIIWIMPKNEWQHHREKNYAVWKAMTLFGQNRKCKDFVMIWKIPIVRTDSTQFKISSGQF